MVGRGEPSGTYATALLTLPSLLVTSFTSLSLSLSFSLSLSIFSLSLTHTHTHTIFLLLTLLLTLAPSHSASSLCKSDEERSEEAEWMAGKLAEKIVSGRVD